VQDRRAAVARRSERVQLEPHLKAATTLGGDVDYDSLAKRHEWDHDSITAAGPPLELALDCVTTMRALDLEPSRFPPRDRFAIQWHRSDPMQSEQRAVSDAEAFARRRGLGRVRQNERRRRTTRALERELGREAALRGKSTQVSVVACSRKLVSVVRPIVRQMRSEGAAIRGSRADGYDNEGSEHNEPFGPEQEQTSDLARRVATVTRARLT